MIKDIVVHLDGSGDDAVRLAYAEAAARRFGAHLFGVYANLLPEVPLAAAEFGASIAVAAAAQDQARAEGDRTHVALAQRFDALDIPSELRRFDLFAPSLKATIASQARAADLFVALRPYDEGRSECWPAVVEAALFGSGRAALVVPNHTATCALAEGGTILIAWRDTAESARAVAEAMPFLHRAREVILAIMDEDEPAEADGEEPGADIARHLDRHGVRVTVRHVGRWDDVGEGLLNEVKRCAADLVVLGAYGHSKMREWAFGGVTRTFLTHCPVPMLMAH